MMNGSDTPLPPMEGAPSYELNRIAELADAGEAMIERLRHQAFLPKIAQGAECPLWHCRGRAIAGLFHQPHPYGRG